MRWFPCFLLMLVLLTAQSTLAPRLAVFGARPDWLLVAVVFLGLFASPRQAAIGGWLLGAGADLLTLERFGLMATSYGLAALMVASGREFLFRFRWVTQLCVTLVTCLVVHAAWLVYHRIAYASAGSVLGDFGTEVVLTSLYTAAWAPLMHRALLSVARPLGLALPRYTYAGFHRLGTGDV